MVPETGEAALDPETFLSRRTSFGAAAHHYDTIRPSYPIEAARWMLGDRPVRVVDVGAGTGIFTRVLSSLGHDVVAVEPDPGMRQKLAAKTPGVEVIEGSAESIPLDDASVDAVVAAQAYHWFDPAKAHPEIARVLKPGGTFSPIWNLRDESVDWVAAMSQVVGMEDGRDSRTGIFEADIADFGPLFAGMEVKEFRHAVTHTADTLVQLVQSRSYYLTASPELKADMEVGIRAITDGLPPEFDLPYVAIAYKTHKA